MRAAPPRSLKRGENDMAEKAKVYFADFRCPSWRENLPQKLARLMMTAGFGDIDMEGKYVAIKMHFGEPGNLAFLRPNWARAVADLVKSQGGKPFLTDCNTLYVGGRKNGLGSREVMTLGLRPLVLPHPHRRRPQGQRRGGGPCSGRPVCEGGQDRPGRDGRGCLRLPDPLQGP